MAATLQDRSNAASRPVDDKAAASPPVQSTPLQAPALPPRYRLTGVVRAEGTGEPIPGAKLLIRQARHRRECADRHVGHCDWRDGRFSTDLWAGDTTFGLREPPAGYWIPTGQKSGESLVIGPDQPVVDREYRLRKGTVWNFRLMRGADHRPFPGLVLGTSPIGLFAAGGDNAGNARLALPSEGGKVALQVREADPQSRRPDTGFLPLALEWEANFRPGELEEVARVDGSVGRFRLIDADGRSATIQAPEPIEPLNQNGELEIRVALAERGPKDVVAIAGRVIDSQQQPIQGGTYPTRDRWARVGRSVAPGDDGFPGPLPPPRRRAHRDRRQTAPRPVVGHEVITA